MHSRLHNFGSFTSRTIGPDKPKTTIRLDSTTARLIKSLFLVSISSRRLKSQDADSVVYHELIVYGESSYNARARGVLTVSSITLMRLWTWYCVVPLSVMLRGKPLLCLSAANSRCLFPHSNTPRWSLSCFNPAERQIWLHSSPVSLAAVSQALQTSMVARREPSLTQT